ncbi:UNVERIFIED_CONTAM: TBC1 domain family member 9B [Sesamum latifolium]|uniref:TBC1 domain family member 9B n=1 Tax=Sesamum latifolium TaxID=2727402 RepID=A0AAW2TC54_9LAMI
MNRDAYGFAVRPQHLQRYREYANIYKEEEEERSDRWKDFLERQCESAQLGANGLSDKINAIKSNVESTNVTADDSSKNDAEADDSNGDSLSEENKEVPSAAETKVHSAQIWTDIRPSLRAIEDMMSSRVKKKDNLIKNELRKQLSSIEEARHGKGASEDDSEEEFYDLERSESDPIQDILGTDGIPSLDTEAAGHESLPPWKEELECLVQGGVPMALRGRARRVEKYYQNLLAPDANVESKSTELEDKNHESNVDSVGISEKWKGQIEKDLPRTFPGHPALDEDGRNALRRLLTAYARHNPSVGYCQAMNFFAGLIAADARGKCFLNLRSCLTFRTLMGILDDYFDGYYSEEMIESQVDQLVLEELVREKFPNKPSGLPGSAGGMGDWAMVPHNIYDATISVLRVWDVLLFEGNRVMLFRTALALMELYGPALVTTKDAGDAVTLLQSLAGSTFDSSQLVLTACMGYQNVQETRLQELRNKHRPAVKASLEERSKGVRVWKDPHGLASKLYSFKKDPGSMMIGNDKAEQVDTQMNGDASHLDSSSADAGDLYMSLNGN